MAWWEVVGQPWWRARRVAVSTGFHCRAVGHCTTTTTATAAAAATTTTTTTELVYA